MSKKLNCLKWVLVAAALCPGAAQAETSEAKPSGAASDNYQKTEDLLPGEEVVTPTGQKIKVWSTAGPVKVSPPPQPFDDPSKGTLDNIPVVVDGTVDGHRRELPRGPRGVPNSGVDRFDLK